MQGNTARGVLAAAALGLALTVGCALDPMERLWEDIDSPDVEVRKAAVLELANMRDDRAIEALVEVLESDEEIFDMAGVALVKQGRESVATRTPDPVITMVAGVMNNPHLPQGNRARAAWVLGEIGNREAVPALRTGAGALDPAGAAAVHVQAQAKLALKKLGDASQGEPFELAMGMFRGEPVDVLPEVEPVAPPEEEEEADDEFEAAVVLFGLAAWPPEKA